MERRLGWMMFRSPHCAATNAFLWLIAVAAVNACEFLRIPATMNYRSAVEPPQIDPVSIFEHYRGSYGTELLTAAVAHFPLFSTLHQQPLQMEELATVLKLQRRPAVVLTTALRAMGLLQLRGDGALELTPLAAEHLTPGGAFEVSDYIGLAASSPGVMEMVERLKTNQPAGSSEEGGVAFIFRDGIKSAMEQSSLARHFTLALAGRAKNTAPVLAAAVDLPADACILDPGGGTGIYSIALLQKYPSAKATVLDAPEVLKIAAGFAEEYGVADRLTLLEGDMFAGELPAADVVLLSNVLHDWDEPACKTLVQRAADALNPGGQLLIHDVFLSDDHSGPLPVALYSAALFTLTEGRAYSGAEYAGWLRQAGLTPQPIKPTLVHCGVLAGVKQ